MRGWLLVAFSVAGGLVLVPDIGRALDAEKPSGTGVVVHRDGYVLSAHHVVAAARRIVVVTPGEFRAPALLVAADPEHDLALLKIETVGLSDVSLGAAGSVLLDQEVIVAGFPFGLREISVSRGRVSAVRSKGVKRVFQVDAAINPGNSGGPVFNRRGELIALVTSKFSHPSGIVPDGMGFAVPVSYAMPLLATIPDFDFVHLGRSGSTRTKRPKEVRHFIDALSRVTVRIETVRAEAPGISPTTADERRPPNPRVQRAAPAIAEPGVDGAGQDPVVDDRAAANVTEALRAAQEQALTILLAHGVHPPDGMVLIPAGPFLMGTNNGLPDARPLHEVVLSAYWIDRDERSNAEYRRCVSDGVCAPPKDPEAFNDPRRADHPVTNVTWTQAHRYCQWLGGRLPTEAEWEKAARGTDGRRYPWGNSEAPLVSRVKAREPANGSPPAGSAVELASPYGVRDVVGAVWEWVRDWYAEDYYAASPTRDPQGPLRGTFRVLRGGDWTQSPLELRVTYRAWDDLAYWGPTLGFRCAADVP